MRAPLSLILSVLLCAGPACAAGTVKTPTGRTGSGLAIGSVAPVAPVVPTLNPVPAVPTLTPGLAVHARLAPVADPSRPSLAPPLAELTPSAAAPSLSALSATSLPLYAQALLGAGAPRAMVAQLDAFLAARHPGDQSQVYHGLQHSRDVAGVAARMAAEAGLSPAQTALVVFAASLHDLDPNRAPGAPPSVKATVAYLEQDREARLLVEQFAGLYGFTPGQVAALIKATDFNPNPDALKAIQVEFERAAGEAFGANAAWALDWGKRLALADKTAAYLGDARQSLTFVRGLAGEFRAAATAAAGKPAGPADEVIVANTHNFMTPLRGSPEFSLLPADLQARYDATLGYFRGIGDPEAAAAALEGLKTPAPTRGPPERAIRDLAAVTRHINSIAAGVKLDDRQRGALLEQWLEEKNIPLGSQRAREVLNLLLPKAAAADDAALRGVAPALQNQRAALLKLARENDTTPAAISDLLASKGLIGDLRGLDAATFERQGWLAMRRASLENAVRRYPDNEQGAFMRRLASNMASPGGKSVEEVARDGVFAYVDFGGAGVLRADTGRDPDVSTSQMVFYVTRREEKWRVDGYRQNRRLGRSDAELLKALKAWLTRGGIPAADFE